jgi:hypothetical protein
MLRELDRPVQPRAEFAEALLSRLLEELADGVVPAGEPARGPVRRPRLLLGARPRLRLALVLIALLLLLAGIATATYLGVREWVSEGPRGVQVASDYRLATVFRDAPRSERGVRLWLDFSLGPGGDDLYSLREPPPYPQHHRAELVRLPGVASAARPVEPERVLSLDSLSDQPQLWDPGSHLRGTVVGAYFGLHLAWTGRRPQVLAVAENGDVFLSVGLWRRPDERRWMAPPISAAVIVLHPDGSLEKLFTLREFVREALPGVLPEDVALTISASVAGRLLVKAQAFEPPLDRGFGRYGVFEVVDPDGDGRWDDRVVRRITLPDSIPTADRAPHGWGMRTWITQIEAEPRSRAFVLLAAGGGRLRIFRLDDRDGDGDATGPGEVAVLLDRSGVDLDPPPSLAVQPGSDGGLVIAGLSRQTRLTLLSPSGEERDIARSFETLEDVLAGPGGRIYAIRQVPGAPPSWIGYRLTPTQNARSAAVPRTPASAAPGANTGLGVPRIAFALESSNFERGRIVAVRADGRGGAEPLVPGRFNHGFCQSADGKRIAYYSDAEAPHEDFLYVASADGSDRRKITEQQVGFWCGFSERWLLLTKQTGAAMTVIRRDLRTGAEQEVVRKADRLALSPDGNRLVYVGGLDFSAGFPPAGRERLVLLDLNTLQHRTLDGPLPTGSYGSPSEGFGLEWAPDGQRIAYTIGPLGYPRKGEVFSEKSPPVRSLLVVEDVASSQRVLVLPLRGGPPAVSWSPDGRKLLVCVPDVRAARGCSDGLRDAKRTARLLLVDLDRGAHDVVARGRLLWAGWSPAGGYGYATVGGVFLVSPAGDVAELANAPRRARAGMWLGFSPDGRYIGLGDAASLLGVIDARTGKLRVLLAEHAGRGYFFYRKWWR